MSEEPKPKRTHTRQLTHQQFYQVCEAVKAHAPDLCKIGSREVVLAKLEEIVGFSFSKDTLNRAADATGTRLRFATKAKIAHNFAHNNLRKLATAMLEICKKIGEEPPVGLVEVTDYYRKRKEDEAQAEQATAPQQHGPVPAKPPAPPLVPAKLTNTAKLPIANLNSDRR